MEVKRALADLAEVRDRLATVQEFRGYSGIAAAISGLIAVIAGFVQWMIAPAPRSPAEIKAYLLIWFVCLAAALAVNYGALALWYWHSARRYERRQTRTIGIAIIPAIAFGAVLSLAMLVHAMAGLLPGIWYASYGIGLFSSRANLPRGVIYVASAFGIVGAALILTPDPTLPLNFWVMPLGFGFGQMFIGYLLSQDRKTEIAS